MKNLISNKSKDEIQAKIKDVCVGLLDEFKRVCTAFELNWWVDSGTLLGACRNNKMIPWDNDVDIAMPRIDYNKLCTLATNTNVFSKNYFFQTSESDAYFETYAKLRDNRSTALTQREYSGKHNRGMFLDIFPIDNVSNDENVRQDVAGFVRTFGKHTRYEYNDKQSNAFTIFNTIMTTLDGLNKDSGLVANVAFWRYRRKLVTIPTQAYDVTKTIEMPFETLTVPVPADANQILTTYYGDDWPIPKQTANIHGYIDPFNKYTLYNNCTQKDFENLTK